MNTVFKQLETVDNMLREDPAYRDIEDGDPLTCSLVQLQAMVAKARTPYAQGYLAGITAMRRSVSQCPLKCSHALMRW